MTLNQWILYITLNGKDYNPQLIDFGMFSGGILPERWYANGCDGYVDDCYKILDFKTEGGKTGNSDVYAYGIVLLTRISKRVYREGMKDGTQDMNEWTTSEDEANCSLVHQSLEGEGFILW